jgi:hypothetical protein
MSGIRAIFSPYELAIASTTEEMTNPDGDDFHTIRGLKLSSIKPIISRYCKASVDYSLVNVAGGDEEPNEEGLRAFAEQVCSFLFQGIPVIYDVDHKRLYGKPEDFSPKTCEEDFHTILIHSVARTHAQRGDGLPYFVFSDSTDLHTTGRIFRVASCEDLVKARLRGGQAEKVGTDGHTQKYEAAIAACMPIHSRSYMPMEKAERRCGQQLPGIPEHDDDIAEAISKYSRVSEVRPALRSRSQLSGYLLKSIFPSVYESPLRRRAEIRHIQKILDALEIPDYVWAAETPDRKVTIIIETIQGTAECFHAIGYAERRKLWIRGFVPKMGMKCWQIKQEDTQLCPVSVDQLDAYPVQESDL